jgi:pyruvate dehydrogenase E1 component alpha subunit
MNPLDHDVDDEPLRVLDADGAVVGEEPDLDETALLTIYRELKLARHFDRRAVSLQRQGRIGTYPPLSGQEAAQVGSAYAMDEADFLVPSYREHAALHVRGMPLERTLLYWMGNEAGTVPPEGVDIYPPSVPIATQIPHATGLAWAATLRGDDRAVVCHFGDGATSEGDFHEGLNFAGVFDVPAVFVCNNNQWAISVPRERQTASPTLAGKAAAYGFDGVRVDGMDPLAVYRVTRAALEKATAADPDPDPDPDAGAGEGDGNDGRASRRRPTLIEAVQYRFGAHTTADDPSVYRTDEEVERWRRLDPIPRFESYLRARGLLDDDRVADVEESVETEVAEAVDAAESTPRPEPTEMFAHVRERMPPRVRRQAESFAALREARGEEAFLRD